MNQSIDNILYSKGPFEPRTIIIAITIIHTNDIVLFILCAHCSFVVSCFKYSSSL